MSEDKSTRISQLLEELQKEGALVKDASSSSALTSQALSDIGTTNAPFEAWVSWTKSF